MSPRLLHPFAILSILIAQTARVPAQDIIVTQPALLPSENPDYNPPVFKKAWKLFCPRTLKNSNRIAYAILGFKIDAKGKYQRPIPNDSERELTRLAESAYDDLQFKPATANGRPVPAGVWLSIIFNPENASPQKADAAPRVLAVTPLFVRGEQQKALRAEKLPGMILATVEIDETGALTGCKPSPHPKQIEVFNRFETEIKKALETWRFAPARAAGNPVAGSLDIPLLLISFHEFLVSSSPPGIPPKVIKQTEPRYPRAMSASRMRGEVTVDFIVDENGDVQNPVVVHSNNPGFDAAAIGEILKWKFKPGTKQGKPVKTKMRIPIEFEWAPDMEGRDAYTVDASGKKRQSQMPENLRYDTPPQVKNAVIPVYPYELAAAGTKGKATVVMLIDKNGRVTGASIIEASSPAFGLGSIAAIESFTFEPAKLDGMKTESALRMEFEFDTLDKSFTMEDRDILKLEKKTPDRIVSSAKLDKKPVTLSQRPPIFPLNVPPGVDKGTAEITFLIDTEGAVRLPRIHAASDPAFGYAAVQAVAQWRYEPPLQNGKKVITRARVPISFNR